MTTSDAAVENSLYRRTQRGFFVCAICNRKLTGENDKCGAHKVITLHCLHGNTNSIMITYLYVIFDSHRVWKQGTLLVLSGSAYNYAVLSTIATKYSPKSSTSSRSPLLTNRRPDHDLQNQNRLRNSKWSSQHPYRNWRDFTGSLFDPGIS